MLPADARAPAYLSTQKHFDSPATHLLLLSMGLTPSARCSSSRVSPDSFCCRLPTSCLYCRTVQTQSAQKKEPEKLGCTSNHTHEPSLPHGKLGPSRPTTVLFVYCTARKRERSAHMQMGEAVQAHACTAGRYGHSTSMHASTGRSAHDAWAKSSGPATVSQHKAFNPWQAFQVLM